MKRTYLMFLGLFFVLLWLCCGCGFGGEQRYVCEVDEVKSVQIISLDVYVENEYRYEYTVLCEITDKEVFVEQLNDLKQTVNWGEPKQFNEGYTVIRIEYFNGDYDLIYSNAQWFNRAGTNQNGYFFFDKTQFDEFISDYLQGHRDGSVC